VTDVVSLHGERIARGLVNANEIDAMTLLQELIKMIKSKELKITKLALVFEHGDPDPQDDNPLMSYGYMASGFDNKLEMLGLITQQLNRLSQPDIIFDEEG